MYFRWKKLKFFLENYEESSYKTLSSSCVCLPYPSSNSHFEINLRTGDVLSLNATMTTDEAEACSSLTRRSSAQRIYRKLYLFPFTPKDDICWWRRQRLAVWKRKLCSWDRGQETVEHHNASISSIFFITTDRGGRPSPHQNFTTVPSALSCPWRSRP